MVVGKLITSWLLLYSIEGDNWESSQTIIRLTSQIL